MSFTDEHTWCYEQFSRARLSDKRRVRRVLTIASAMAENPGVSIPRLFDDRYDVKAAYNLFNHPEATPESLQAGHREVVKERLRQPGVALLLEDTTELAWVSDEIEGLGPVGNGSELVQGFLLHTVLAARWAETSPKSALRPPLEMLGVADQQYHIRKPAPSGERKNWRGQQSARDRESDLWQNASEHLGQVPEGTRWVRICDRGADIYEFLRSCQELGHGYVIRAASNRGLASGGRLFEEAKASPVLGSFDLFLRSRPGKKARTACLSVSAQRVSLRSPQRPGHSIGGLPPIDCTIVRVWEQEPPAGVAPLEWLLLTDAPVQDFDQALTCALQYSTRWVIEEFHKALKTGLGAERLQLETAHRLFAAISIMSVVALRLVDLKERVRISPQAPAEEAGLEPFELQVLALRLKRDLKTAQDVALAIGRLGGHMNRKGDGMPGLLTLWHGMQKLQALVAGARLGLQLRDLGKD